MRERQETRELTTDERLISIAYAKHLSIVCQPDGQLTANSPVPPSLYVEKYSI